MVFLQRFKVMVELEDDPQLLTKVVTGDESWRYSYNPESKQGQAIGSH
jgi:hypothetical protein